MGTAKHRNLTVDTLTVTGALNLPEGALPAAVAPETRPVAPYPRPLPEKLTMAALKDRQDFILGVLQEAGLISACKHPEDRGE